MDGKKERMKMKGERKVDKEATKEGRKKKGRTEANTVS